MQSYSDYLNTFDNERLIVSSSNKMSLDKFNGVWTLQGEFPVFTKIINDRLFGINEKIDHQVDYSSNYIDIKIYPAKGSFPDPSTEQISTINFLLENQNLMLDAFFQALKNVIYPELKELLDDEEYWFPKLSTVEDLSKTINITRIVITALSKDGYSYVNFQSNFSADDDHGLEMEFHKTRLIEYNAIGESIGKGVIEDMGLDYEKFMEESRENYRKPSEYYKPHPKYGILTQGQFESNQSYPNRLLYEKRYDELIIFLESEKVRIEDYNSSLLSTAIRNSMDSDLIDYLFESKPTNLYSLFALSAKQHNFEYLERILKLGYDINQEEHQPSILCEMLLEYKRNFSDEAKVKQIKETIEFLMKRGADPYIGGVYKRDAFWNVERIESEGIRSEINVYLHNLCNEFNHEIKVKKVYSEKETKELRKWWSDLLSNAKNNKNDTKNTKSNFINSILFFLRRWRRK